VFLGRPLRRGPFLDNRAMEARFRALAAELDVAIAPRARAGSLSVANRQMLEIMRALMAEHRILIMDEPTASLGPHEREKLYETVRRLRAAGTAVIYISHDLDEVLKLCDRISVMRDGALVACQSASAWSKESLVGAMLGMAVRKSAAHTVDIGTEELLRVEALSVPGLVHDLSFSLGKGEILGIAGLVGAGRTEILRSLAGCQPGATGRLFIDGKAAPLPRSVRRALALGIALAPEDRKAQGLVLSQNGIVNVTLADMDKIARGPFLRFDKRKSDAETIAGALGFDPKRLGVLTGNLSGGNQQKLVVGKWLHRPPRVLLMDEPTRGIDVGAKAEMFAVMRGLTRKGLSVIMVSSELEEVLDNADRILVLAKGRQRALLRREEATLARVLNLIFAVEGAAA
jgi:ABC-type sugar transport system ATPase subunit